MELFHGSSVIVDQPKIITDGFYIIHIMHVQLDVSFKNTSVVSMDNLRIITFADVK